MTNNNSKSKSHSTPPLNAAGTNSQSAPPSASRAVIEINCDCDGSSPSRLPLIIKSPLAQLPLAQALNTLVSPDHRASGIDQIAWNLFQHGLVRKRVLVAPVVGAGASTEIHVDAIWSPGLGTGVLVDYDITEGIVMAMELRTLTTSEIAKGLREILAYTGQPYLHLDEHPVTVNRELITEVEFLELFERADPNWRDEVRKEVAAALVRRVRWMDGGGAE